MIDVEEFFQALRGELGPDAQQAASSAYEAIGNTWDEGNQRQEQVVNERLARGIARFEKGTGRPLTDDEFNWALNQCYQAEASGEPLPDLTAGHADAVRGRARVHGGGDSEERRVALSEMLDAVKAGDERFNQRPSDHQFPSEPPEEDGEDI